MSIPKIKKITIVTDQGVKEFYNTESEEIKKTYYYEIGDPYDCYSVIDRESGQVLTEIRCTHQLVIDFYKEEKQ